MDTKKVWFVTGASKGLGLTLVKTLLAEGYRVAATSRNSAELLKAVGQQSSSFLPIQVDLLSEESVGNALAETIAQFGAIDVVVNNAGYGQTGTLEELSDKEARQNFDVNVFAPLNVIRSVMPHFRSKQSGYIINVSSVAGILGTFPGFGIYCATKFAMAGFTESLSEEAKEFGVKATVVYPGYFRTNFLDKASLNLPQNPIEDYTAARNSEKWHEDEMKGKQPGSPEKAALAFIQLAENEQPPLHFFMGNDAFGMANQKIEILQQELENYEALSKSTDF
jgi:NAD(P)-dependent dehydrogenase (short-subunit alcohol dehydrogenase family)